MILAEELIILDWRGAPSHHHARKRANGEAFFEKCYEGVGEGRKTVLVCTNGVDGSIQR